MEAIYGIIGFVAVAYFIYNRTGKASLVSLALSKYSFNPEAEDFLVIEGRKTGLWQWILVQLKLGNRYQITVNKDQISYSEDSARGNLLTLTPLAKIASTLGGYKKPIGLLIVAALLAISGIASFFIGFMEPVNGLVLILFAALLVVYYIYKKMFFIYIQPVSGALFGFEFKRSFIENVAVDIKLIDKSIAYLNEKVIETNK